MIEWLDNLHDGADWFSHNRYYCSYYPYYMEIFRGYT